MCITDTASLSEKCVINLADGKNLGYACDVKFDTSCGKIVAIVVPTEQGIFSFGKDEVLVIPWEKVECIGEDAVLVRICVSECCETHDKSKNKGKKRFPLF